MEEMKVTIIYKLYFSLECPERENLNLSGELA
jgi:hypothetical protein